MSAAKVSLIASVWLLAASSQAYAQEPLPAFPGAEGFGAHTIGGRGGEVYHVVHLNDSGAGSLRDAVSKGRRTVVFDVGGYVELKSILHVSSDITIAGQTAPGEGIGVKNYEVSFSGSHNIICRYIRFRQGVTARQDKKCAVNIYDGHDMIFDHVSIAWGRWDTIGINKSKNITFQNCIIAEGVAPQRFGCLCQGEQITFSHNLWINHHSRNPKAKGKVQFINNVVYNWELDAYIAGGNSAGESWHDVVGNYFIKGPSTGGHGGFAKGNTNAHVYAADNYLADNRSGKLDGKLIEPAALSSMTSEKKPFAVPPVAVTVDVPAIAYEKIVASAGCSLRRDAVDTRLIDELTSLGKKGKLIRDPAEVGGFGDIKGGPIPKDSDGDGIPDEWEIAHGLNPKDASDRNRLGPDRYTMLEVYLNRLAAKGGAPVRP